MSIQDCSVVGLGCKRESGNSNRPRSPEDATESEMPTRVEGSVSCNSSAAKNDAEAKLLTAKSPEPESQRFERQLSISTSMS